MLRKLLKYDLRANMKIFLFIWPAIVLFALLERLVLQADMDPSLSVIFGNLTGVFYVLAVIAACVFAYVISVIRFYSGLLRDEGYLMFTLPVKAWQLIVSKFLTALLTVSVTILLSIGSVFLLFSGFDSFQTALKQIFSTGELFNGLTWTLLIVMLLVQLAMSILQIYLSCSIGHLFRRRRILFAVLFYYAINVAVEAVSVTAVVLLSTNETFQHLIDQVALGAGTAANFFNLFLGVVLLVMVLLSLVYYFITERILRRRLNLE